MQRDSNFWNKNKKNVDVIITSPSSLDVYFGKPQSRMSIGHLCINRQINEAVSDESISCVLSKKLRGVKINNESRNILLKQVPFVDKKSKNKSALSLEELLNYFVEFKEADLAKALIADKLNQMVIRPFLKVYLHFLDKQIQINSKPDRIKRQFQHIFNQILAPLSHQLYQFQVEEEQLSIKNTKIISEVDRIMSQMNEKENKDDQINEQGLTFATYNNLKSSKLIHPSTKKMLKTGHLIGTEKILRTKKEIKEKTTKKIKFKNIPSNEEEDSEMSDKEAENLCYELGLLISDTNRILKPSEEQMIGAPNEYI